MVKYYLPMIRRSIVYIITLLMNLCVLYTVPVFAAAIRHIHPQTLMPVTVPERILTNMNGIYRWSVRDIINAIKDSGIVIEEIRRGIIVGPPGAQGVRIFRLPHSDRGGLIASFSEEAPLINAWIYYSAMNKDPDHPSWYIYRLNNILVLISGDAPRGVLRKIEDTLYRLSKTE